MGKRSPFLSCTLTSAPLASVRVPWFLTFGQRLFGERLVAVGSLENMLRQGETVAQNVLGENPRFLAGPQGSDTATRYLICSVWLAWWRFDRRLRDLQRWISNYVARTPELSKVKAVLVVSANGVPLDPVMRQLREYYLGGACLYTLPVTFPDSLQLPATRELVTPATAEELLDDQKVSRNGSSKKHQRV